MSSAKRRTKAPKLYVGIFDAHCPLIDIPTRDACLNFISRNKVHGVILDGDQVNGDAWSHHNKGKTKIEASGTIKGDIEACDKQLITPIERLVGRECEKVWLDGNHDDWIYQYIEEHPQTEGSIEPNVLLRLKERGWKYLRQGSAHRVGKLTFIHGDTLSGRYHAQQAVERYCTNVAYGHFHTVQSAIKILPHNAEQRWVAQSFPAMCGLNPTYLRNKPTAWVNGFGIFEFYDGGFFNMWPVVVTRGRFTFGGRVYKS